MKRLRETLLVWVSPKCALTKGSKSSNDMTIRGAPFALANMRRPPPASPWNVKENGHCRPHNRNRPLKSPMRRLHISIPHADAIDPGSTSRPHREKRASHRSPLAHQQNVPPPHQRCAAEDIAHDRRSPLRSWRYHRLTRHRLQCPRAAHTSASTRSRSHVTRWHYRIFWCCFLFWLVCFF